jgi:hypothetical protein
LLLGDKLARGGSDRPCARDCDEPSKASVHKEAILSFVGV